MNGRAEQGLLIELPMSGPADVARLDGALRARFEGYDGWAYGDGMVTFYLYGPDADALWADVQETVEGSPLADDGGNVTVRYGPPRATGAGARR